MVDVEHVNPMHTWRNFFYVDEVVSKWLENNLVSESLLNDGMFIQSTIETGGISNHLQVVQFLEKVEKRIPPLMKFNPHWI